MPLTSRKSERGPSAVRAGINVPDLDTGDRYRGAWWRKIVKPGLKAAPDVTYDDGDRVWKYVSDVEDDQ